MPKLRLGHAFVAVLLLVAMLAQGTWALAGTTGGISGTLTDTTTGKPVGDAKVIASSPSETASATTDAGGHFTFLNLAPDTYSLSVNKEGFAPTTVGGVTVFADQSMTVSLQTQPQLKTIAKITSRAAGNLVKPGTTADVYSVNAATQQVVSGSGGGFNLNQSYSAVYSQPGVTSYVGNYGWGQVFYIRGGSYSQTGYEFDGVPVNRAFDNYQADSLSSLGQQELQVYTGGSPSGASSATLGGFINQVIKTGTYPGFGGIKAGIGSPAFYHGLQVEAGGSNPNRTFSYYVGLNSYNQHYPIDNRYYSSIDPTGHGPSGLQADQEFVNQYLPLCAGMQCNGLPYGVPFGYYGNAVPDGGQYQFQYGNGPWSACSRATGLPAGENLVNVGGGTMVVGRGNTPATTYNGSCIGYTVFGSGVQSEMYERNTVLNFHFALPHKNDSGRDDIQLLYDNSMQYGTEDSSINDNGGLPLLNSYMQNFAPDSNPGSAYPGLCGEQNDWSFGCASANSPIPYPDAKIFAPGTSFGQSVSSATINPYYFPNSPQNRPLNNLYAFSPTYGIPTTLRDGNFNDVGIVKAQYTKNIGSSAYARLFGYTFYSDWLNGGPTAAATAYLDGFLPGGMFGNTPDYELSTHTRGAEFQFADQINAQNLLKFTANYTTASVDRFNNSTWRASSSSSYKAVTNLTNGDPNNPMCFSASSGNQASCYSSSTYGTFAAPTKSNPSANPCGDGTLAPTTPACVNGAKWLVTVPGGQGTWNTVRPVFTSAALEDDFKPNDKLDLNLGLRFESYQYNLSNTNTPEMNFWFNAAAQTVCYDPKTGQPQLTTLAPGQPVPPSPKSTAPLASCGLAPSGVEGLHPVGNTSLCNGTTKVDCGPIAYTAKGASTFTHSAVSPRVGLTYTLSPNTVLRASAGKYTQPTETAFEQYVDQSGKRAANFDFSRFWGLGFNTPAHDNPIQYSNNYDFSVEHHFNGTDITLKASPFYRDTHNEIVELVLGPGFVSGTNVGHQKSYGLEFQVQKGDPSRDGLAGAVSYTYTKAQLQYGNLPNGTNAIDYLNNYITEFNALTKAGGGSPCYDPTAATAAGSNAPSDCSKPTDIANPYYNLPTQGLMDRNAYYNSYPDEPPNDPTDQGGTTAIVPHSFSAWLQYKHGRFAIAPNMELFAGANYGSPTETYGVDPRWCTQNQAAATDTSGASLGLTGNKNPDFLSCGATGNTAGGYLAIPDPYGPGQMKDQMQAYKQPWIFNMGALITYEISPKVTANLHLTNLVNRCFGGTQKPWQQQFKPSNYVCGYGNANGSWLGPQQGQPGFGGGFFYGSNPSSAVNDSPNYAPAYNYPFAPAANYNPFQAYLELQIKL